MQEFDDEDDGPITLGAAGGPEEADLGPDEHDMDLMDGSWEEKYYSGRVRSFNWRAITAALGVLVLIALLVPALLTVFGR